MEKMWTHLLTATLKAVSSCQDVMGVNYCGPTHALTPLITHYDQFCIELPVRSIEATHYFV